MRTHLEGCPACAEDHESLLAINHTLTAARWRNSSITI